MGAARALLLGMVVAGGALITLVSAAAGEQTLELNSRQQLGPYRSVAGPVSTTESLASGATYDVLVTGTASIWSTAEWAEGPPCGEPEAHPMFPSPGVENGPVGWDAATVFAVPPQAAFDGFKCNSGVIPFGAPDTGPGFEVSTGKSFSRINPFAGARSVPSPAHTYRYVVTGAGAPASFQFADEPLDDNYGIFRITVMSEAECVASACQNAEAAEPEEASGVQEVGVTGRGAVGLLQSKVALLPTADACSSRREFKVTFFKNRGVKIVSVSFSVNGHVIKTLHGGRLSTIVSLRGFPKGVFVLRLRAVTSRGQVLVDTRRYHTCIPKLPIHRDRRRPSSKQA